MLMYASRSPADRPGRMYKVSARGESGSGKTSAALPRVHAGKRSPTSESRNQRSPPWSRSVSGTSVSGTSGSVGGPLWAVKLAGAAHGSSLWQPAGVIVVATIEAELDGVHGRLRDLGAAPRASWRRARCVVSCWPPVPTRATRSVSPPCSARDGLIAVARPDAGPRLAAWQRDTQPLTIGERLSICFAWSEHDRDGLPGLVELGPGGFGSGAHPTTRLLHRRAARAAPDGGERVLDVGCGSGVLGLCALRLGAARGRRRRSQAGRDRRHTAQRGAQRRRRPAPRDARPAQRPRGRVRRDRRQRRAGGDRRAGPRAQPAPGAGRLARRERDLPAQCEQVGGFLRPLAEQRRRTEGDWASVVFVRTG